MDSDNRTTQRLDFGLKVTLLEPREAYFTGDISIKGCFIPSRYPFQSGERVNLAIDVPSYGPVLVTGQVRHVGKNGVGIMFDEVRDPAGKRALEEFLQVISLC